MTERNENPKNRFNDLFDNSGKAASESERHQATLLAEHLESTGGREGTVSLSGELDSELSSAALLSMAGGSLGELSAVRREQLRVNVLTGLPVPNLTRLQWSWWMPWVAGLSGAVVLGGAVLLFQRAGTDELASAGSAPDSEKGKSNSPSGMGLGSMARLSAHTVAKGDWATEQAEAAPVAYRRLVALAESTSAGGEETLELQVELFRRLSEAAFGLNLHDDALRWAERGLALRTAPSVSVGDLWVLQGRALVAVGDRAGAAESFLKAIEIQEQLLAEDLK